MITLVETCTLEEDTTQPNVHILSSHQLEKSTSQPLHNDEERFHHLTSDHQEESHPLPKIQNVISQANSPHCLVCNAKLGVSARGAMEVFSDKAKTSHRQLHVHIVLSTIVNQDVSAVVSHSSIVCKKCFKLIDDIDSLEGQLINMKQVVTNKYMRTLAIVKQDCIELENNIENVLEEDTINLEASSLTKDDKDFKVYVSSGLSGSGSVSGGSSRGKRGRRGRGRGRPPSVKLEVKQEEAVEVITGLAASDAVEPFRHQGLLSSSDSNDVLGGRLEDRLEEEDGGGADMLMVEEEIFEDSAVVDAVEDVMEVDGLNLDDTEGCVQIGGLTLPSLGNTELGVGPDSPSSHIHTDPQHPDNQQQQHIPEEAVEKYKCRFCSLKLTVLADIQAHMREAHPERLYECEVCNERLPTKADLVCHLEQHIASGEKPYSCTMCSRKYALPRQLKEHMRHHMNKTFGCSHCPKRFRSEAALQEHFNVHTGNRPYSCDQCLKRFTSKHILKTHMKTHGHGHSENVEAYIKINPPTIVSSDVTGEGSPSPSGTVRTLKLDEEQSMEPSLDAPMQLVRGGVREGEAVDVVSRPVHIIEADDLPRYIIHTSGGERAEEVGHFLASLQGQVVEVRTEDLDRYTDLTTDQMTQVAQVAAQVVAGQQTSNGIQQVAVSGEIRPFNIQLESSGREITLQAQPSSREVATSIGASGTATTRDATIPTVSQVQANAGTTVLVGGRQMQYESGGLTQGTLRKVLTDREELRTISVHNIAASDSHANIYYNLPPPLPTGLVSSRKAGGCGNGNQRPTVIHNQSGFKNGVCCTVERLRPPLHDEKYEGNKPADPPPPPLHKRGPKLTRNTKKLSHTRSIDLDNLYQNIVRVATKPRSNSFSIIDLPWRRKKKETDNNSKKTTDIKEDSQEDAFVSVSSSLTPHSYHTIVPSPPPSSPISSPLQSKSKTLSNISNKTSSLPAQQHSNNNSSCSTSNSNNSDIEGIGEYNPVVHSEVTYVRGGAENSCNGVEVRNSCSGGDVMTNSWYSSAETLPLTPNSTSKSKKSYISESAPAVTCHQEREKEVEEEEELQRAVDVNAKLDEWLRKERWLEKKKSAVNGCTGGRDLTLSGWD
ncbi:hypothetical protein Pmani_009999 [Petrolisthes manimaculis]|uniref:C2H2-type domain-containing protein n=1 Tax=Petrolisthes manimaculis TaxID=1843537 RepID=A0AAE1Q2B7_9EUCA|nr:hypothetical protein Pmani_009999 [Petrolisthes manimaculis]